ncbi:hypothetical protein ACWCXX_21495 [Streptomyces sp. NPDC001732]
MRRYGGLSPERAWAAAPERYPYEPADASFRGLVFFHDEPWHWAMGVIHGERYMEEHPEPAEYQELD